MKGLAELDEVLVTDRGFSVLERIDPQKFLNFLKVMSILFLN